MEKWVKIVTFCWFPSGLKKNQPSCSDLYDRTTSSTGSSCGVWNCMHESWCTVSKDHDKEKAISFWLKCYLLCHMCRARWCDFGTGDQISILPFLLFTIPGYPYTCKLKAGCPQVQGSWLSALAWIAPRAGSRLVRAKKKNQLIVGPSPVPATCSI